MKIIIKFNILTPKFRKFADYLNVNEGGKQERMEVICVPPRKREKVVSTKMVCDEKRIFSGKIRFCCCCSIVEIWSYMGTGNWTWVPCKKSIVQESSRGSDTDGLQLFTWNICAQLTIAQLYSKYGRDINNYKKRSGQERRLLTASWGWINPVPPSQMTVMKEENADWKQKVNYWKLCHMTFQKPSSVRFKMCA